METLIQKITDAYKNNSTEIAEARVTEYIEEFIEGVMSAMALMSFVDNMIEEIATDIANDTLLDILGNMGEKTQEDLDLDHLLHDAEISRMIGEGGGHHHDA